MTRLAILRTQLESLRRARQLARRFTGWCATVFALIALLGVLLVLDSLFQLPVRERLVVIGLGLIAVGWVFWRYTLPHVGIREDEVELAIWVEHHQRIDSDLVAAL